MPEVVLTKTINEKWGRAGTMITLTQKAIRQLCEELGSQDWYIMPVLPHVALQQEREARDKAQAVPAPAPSRKAVKAA